jgi:CCR4-NOT transcription complex subunit 4
MARGKSSDSTQSTNPPSLQASPKKKPISLSRSASTNIKAPPPGITPPPGLTPAPAPVPAPVEKVIPVAAAPAPQPIPAEVEDTMPEETNSGDSEAGPSSASPAPRTPVQTAEDDLPAPLRSDPIVVHSPYDEPEIYTFPTSDPDFEFVLGLESTEFYDYQSPSSPFTPTPFSKTLVGLAELGIWSPTLPVVDPSTRPPHAGFRSSFQPFEMNMSNETPMAVAGPSRARDEPVEEEDEPRRTTSRFDFARQNHNYTPSSFHSASRGQSPFALRRTNLNEQTNDWAPPTPMGMGMGMGNSRQMQQQHQQFEEQLVAQRQQSQHTGDSRASAFAQQVASFVGSYGSSSGPEWGQAQAQAQAQAQGQGQAEHIGSPGVRIDGRMSGLSMGRQRDDFDPGTSCLVHLHTAKYD